MRVVAAAVEASDRGARIQTFTDDQRDPAGTRPVEGEHITRRDKGA